MFITADRQALSTERISTSLSYLTVLRSGTGVTIVSVVFFCVKDSGSNEHDSAVAWVNRRQLVLVLFAPPHCVSDTELGHRVTGSMGHLGHLG